MNLEERARMMFVRHAELWTGKTWDWNTVSEELKERWRENAENASRGEYEPRLPPE